MCGRFVTRAQAAEERHFALVRSHWNFQSYNVAPTQQIPIVWMRDGEREGVMARWGLIPWWAKGVAPKYLTINARFETLKTTPAFRDAWSRGQRCIVPVLGFYEWQLRVSGKQPFYIQLNDQEVFGLAGLWDRSRPEDGDSIYSCTVITMPANELMSEIHDKQRMPAILRAEDHGTWLEGSNEDAFELLKPYPSEAMVAVPVSTRVNSSKNDDPTCIEPIQLRA